MMAYNRGEYSLVTLHYHFATAILNINLYWCYICCRFYKGSYGYVYKNNGIRTGPLQGEWWSRMVGIKGKKHDMKLPVLGLKQAFVYS